MRLFAGLDIPEEVKGTLEALLDGFRPAAKLRWSPVGNLHVTTKFIGEWPDQRLEEMKQALSGVRGEPIPISIRGLGWFPNPHSPRTFWAASRGGEALLTLAAATDEASKSIA